MYLLRGIRCSSEEVSAVTQQVRMGQGTLRLFTPFFTFFSTCVLSYTLCSSHFSVALFSFSILIIILILRFTYYYLFLGIVLLLLIFLFFTPHHIFSDIILYPVYSLLTYKSLY